MGAPLNLTALRSLLAFVISFAVLCPPPAKTPDIRNFEDGLTFAIEENPLVAAIVDDQRLKNVDDFSLPNGVSNDLLTTKSAGGEAFSALLMQAKNFERESREMLTEQRFAKNMALEGQKRAKASLAKRARVYRLLSAISLARNRGVGGKEEREPAVQMTAPRVFNEGITISRRPSEDRDEKSSVRLLEGLRISKSEFQVSKTQVRVAELSQRIEDQNWLEGLRPELRRRIENSNGLETILDGDWKGQTLAEAFADAVEKSAGEGVATHAARASFGDIGTNLESSVKGTENRVKTESPYPSLSKKDSDGAPFEGRLAETDPLVSIAGTFILDGGLAYLGEEDRIRVRREIAGEIIEEGEIDIRRGIFNISIEPSDLGWLVIEHRRRGELVGLAAKKVTDITSIPITLKVAPVPSGVNGTILSEYSHKGSQVLVNQMNTSLYGDDSWIPTKEGSHFEYSSLSWDSVITLRAKGDNHWPSIWLLNSGHQKELHALPDRFVEALLSTSKTPFEIKEFGVIWGRVERDGRPVAGARVEIADDGAYGPIYFQNFLGSFYFPDSKLKETTANGLYAFIKVPAGLHRIRCHLVKGEFPDILMPVEEQTVSFAHFIDRGLMRVNSFSYDAFTGEPISSELEVFGKTKSLKSEDGIAEVTFRRGQPLIHLLAVPGDRKYLPQTRTLNSRTRHINTPLVRKEWLLKLAESRKINRDSNRGILVGFAPDHRFSVDLLGADSLKNLEVVYFNSQGEALPVKSSGIGGGGFAIFNVPLGLQTVQIFSENSDTVSLLKALSTPETLGVITSEL
jgi:hypothetical protein